VCGHLVEGFGLGAAFFQESRLWRTHVFVFLLCVCVCVRVCVVCVCVCVCVCVSDRMGGGWEGGGGGVGWGVGDLSPDYLHDAIPTPDGADRCTRRRDVPQQRDSGRLDEKKFVPKETHKRQQTGTVYAARS